MFFLQFNRSSDKGRDKWARKTRGPSQGVEEGAREVSG